MLSTHSTETPGTDDFRKPVDVECLHVEGGFNLVAHGLRPRFRAEYADLHRTPARIQPPANEFVSNGQQVRRGHRDDPRLELVDDLHLSRGESSRRGNDGTAEALGAAVKPETAGEQAVAVGHLHHVAGTDTGGTHRPRHDLGPHFQVALGVADDGGSTGGPARRMNTNHPGARHREHAERIVATQIFLYREWKVDEVPEGFEIGRIQTSVVEA